MTQRALVLGCGLVGSTIARELARSTSCRVTAADISERNLKRLGGDGIETRRADLGQPAAIGALVRDFDIVLGALPSHLGFQTLQTVIEAGRPYCDISFMPEDALALDGLAKRRGVTAIVDCGVSPGLSNLMVGFAAAQLGEVEQAAIYVGGLPKVRRWPYNYKAPFAPADVVEEYTRPARLIEHGKLVVKPALSEVELIELSSVGTLEAFNTDGLRSLLATVQATNMKEKTLRYPGHAELMRALRETGFFNKSPIEIGGVEVRPLDVTSKLLFPRWAYTEKEEEFTVLRVMVEGGKASQRKRFTFDLYDEYDRERGESSMARTTGFPCVAAAKLILEGRWKEPGVHPPELLAKKPGLFEAFLVDLKGRGIDVTWRSDDAGLDPSVGASPDCPGMVSAGSLNGSTLCAVPSPREFKVMDAPPPDYERFIVEEVRPAGENLTIRYGGRVFGGIVRCLLPSQEVEAALEPGCELFVRYHRPDTGQPGQVAHMLIRHPSEPGWAEVYSEID